MNLLRKGIRPSDILTREAFENAVTLVVALGGSTNSALHLPAIAYEMGLELTLEDIHDISMRTPLIADMKPGGNYLMFECMGTSSIAMSAFKIHMHGIC